MLPLSLSRVLGVVAVALIVVCGLDAVAASARTEPSQRRGIDSCAVPRGAKLVAQSSLVRVIRITNPGGRVREDWRYCVRAEGHGFRPLADATTSDAAIVDLGPIVVAGAYVAYSTETIADAGRYGNNPVGVLYVRDLVAGTSKSDPIDCGVSSTVTTNAFCAVGPTDYFCSAPYCGAKRPVLILSPDGVAAWEGEQKCFYSGGSAWRPCAWELQALDGRTGWQAVLDEVPPTQGEYVDDPFADVRLYDCAAGCSTTDQLVATWTHDGIWHSSTVR
jgi:hypothetical protein